MEGLIFMGIIVAMIFLQLVPLPLWGAAFLSGVYINPWDLISLKFFRHINPGEVVIPAITAKFAEVPVSLDLIQAHRMAGGSVDKVVAALIAANKANIALDWNTATSIDLAGRDVLRAVQMSVNPKVIKTPPIAAMAQDGIQLKAHVLVTVRTDIGKLIGSAGEDTVLARVGEGIVTAIGKSHNYREVLEHPDLIAEAVLATGLDSGTAFDILSIDIADLDVGTNIGARLQIDQANADKQVAQARAEQRRAEAKAQQQQMRAKVEEMKAKVVEAEAEVPAALAEALENGTFSALDYYKMQNVIADTRMRENIAGAGPGLEPARQV